MSFSLTSHFPGPTTDILTVFLCSKTCFCQFDYYFYACFALTFFSSYLWFILPFFSENNMQVFRIVPCILITSYKQQHLSLFKMMVYSTRYQGKDNFTKKHLPLKLKMRKNVGSLNIFCITRLSSHHTVDKNAENDFIG